jgi:hypothetical protein
MKRNIDNLIDNRSDPHTRAVLEDLCWEQNARPPTRLGLALATATAYATSDYPDYADNADAAPDATSVDDDDDATATTTDDAAYATFDYADYADAAPDAASDDDDDDDDTATTTTTTTATTTTTTTTTDDATDGATDGADAAANYDYAASDAAHDTDEHFSKLLINQLTKALAEDPDMRNGLKIIQVPGMYSWAVTRVGWLRRVIGDEWELIGARSIIRTGAARTLDSLAAHGPKDDHRLTPTSEAPEEINRLLIRRSLRADVKVWAQDCPRPSGWIDD